jgi:hypothetical protein
MQPYLLALWCLGTLSAIDKLPQDTRLMAKPDAFKTLVNPECSHCRDEAIRRASDLRDNDPVLCWIRDTKGHYNGGAIPLRFFLNPYRVISDSYGVFVYDPDAGYARGFAPSFDFSFYGWRNGVMVMKHKDGTLYSCLTGVAFAGPGKGKHLNPVPTIVSEWGYWLKHYRDSVAYHMYDKYQPVPLPDRLNADSVRSRGSADTRLPADAMVLGVVAGAQAKAFPLETLAKVGIIHDRIQLGPNDYEPVVVLWEPATKTAVAYVPVAPPPPAVNGAALRVTLVKEQGPDGFILRDKETGSRWDVTGRAVAGDLKGSALKWVDSTEVKWFAWSAEYPHTSIYQPK